MTQDGHRAAMPTEIPRTCPQCGARYGSGAAYCPQDGTRLRRPTPPGADSLPGTVLEGRYRIEERLGRGGMGTVYRARLLPGAGSGPLGPGDQVALKVLHRELCGDVEVVRRFEREARVAARLEHPNVVEVLGIGQLPDGRLYLVMEYLRGCSLAELLRREGPLAPSRAVGLVLQLCEGMGQAHASGVVHRDVKPENAMVLSGGSGGERLKVLDFGVARLLEDSHTVRTRTGVIFGTVRYISPEGAAGEPTDPRSDVYSIGVLLYELLTGDPPFEADSGVAMLMKHISTPAPRLEDHPRFGGAPAGLGAVLEWALQKDPDARPADARELASALRAGMEGSVQGERPPVARPSRDTASFPQRRSLQAGGMTMWTGAAVASGNDPRPETDPDVGRKDETRVGRESQSASRLLRVAAVAFLLGGSAVALGAWLGSRMPWVASSPSGSARGASGTEAASQGPDPDEVRASNRPPAAIARPPAAITRPQPAPSAGAGPASSSSGSNGDPAPRQTARSEARTPGDQSGERDRPARLLPATHTEGAGRDRQHAGKRQEQAPQPRTQYRSPVAGEPSDAPSPTTLPEVTGPEGTLL